MFSGLVGMIGMQNVSGVEVENICMSDNLPEENLLEWFLDSSADSARL